MLSSEKPCAYCGKRPRAAAFGPFCSAGCQDRDLLQWLNEAYVLPAGGDDDELAENAGAKPMDSDG
jgi:uncharacterized protein